MTEHPILFTDKMIVAILEGLKTQTRRVITDRRVLNTYASSFIGEDGARLYEDRSGNTRYVNDLCPYGKPGDVLWVREAWSRVWRDGRVVYRAGPHDGRGVPLGWSRIDDRWRPSIHMPRELCRIFLRLKSRRAEPLQEITEEDSAAEGIVLPTEDGEPYIPQLTRFSPINYAPSGLRGPALIKAAWTHRMFFASYWDELNADRGYPWRANPLVWVLEFERVENASPGN